MAARLSTRDVAAAESLIDIRCTPEERAQMLPVLERRLSDLRTLRMLDIPRGVGAGEFVVQSTSPIKREKMQIKQVNQKASTITPPSSIDDIAFGSLGELGAWLAQGDVTSVGLAEMYLNRIERFNPNLQAIVTTTAGAALRAAAESDARRQRGCALGPLDGIPFLTKDLIDSAGVPTTWGSALPLVPIPSTDAHVVALLKRAGAVELGKASCGELGYGDRWFGGQSRNPWNLEEGSSGSSGGSAAAVAAGLCGFALGTDTLGSVAMPAERCGVVGLRPTFGRISRSGVMPLCPSLDTVGLLVRQSEDLTSLLHELVAPDQPDEAHCHHPFEEYPTPNDGAGLRIGYVPAFFEPPFVNDTGRIFLSALRGLQWEMRPVEWPALPFHLLRLLAECGAAETFRDVWQDGATASLAWQGEAAWPNLWRVAQRLPATDYVRLLRLRTMGSQALAACLDQVDVLVTPHHAGDAMVAGAFAGHPSIALPYAMMAAPTRDLFGRNMGDGATAIVPQGISFIGKPFGENCLIAVCAMVETMLGRPRTRPPFFTHEGKAT